MNIAGSKPDCPGCGMFIFVPQSIFKEFVMRALLSIAVLMSASVSAFAAPTFNVPEPESLALIAIAAVGMLLVRRNKK